MIQKRKEKPSSRPSSVTCRLAPWVAVLLIPGVGQADWEFDPALRVAADFDDNANLSHLTAQEDSIEGYIGELDFEALYRSETGIFSINPVIRTRGYDSNTDRDSDDQFLNFRMRRDGQFHTFGLRGNYSRESVRTAELADAELDADLDPDEIEDDDSSLISTRDRREKFRIVPSWTYQFSDVSSWRADVGFLTVDYINDDPAQGNNLVDYTDIRGRLSYQRNMSARNTGILSVTARNYQTDELGGDVNGYGVSAGFNRAMTETTTFRALIGVEETERINDSNEPSFVTDISLVRSQETTRLLLQYRQRVSASGRGQLVERNEVNLRFTRALNDKFSAGLGARAYQTTALGNIDNETNYVQLHAQLLWQISNAFSMRANYRHTVIDRAINGESANSNRFTLWFTYRPNSRSRITFQPQRN